MSSGTLRGTSHTARAPECETITGACETRSASAIVSARRGRCRPACRAGSSRGRPPRRRGTGRRASASSVAASAHGTLLVVGQRHVARAEAVQHAQHGQRVVDRVAALDADQRGDLAGLDRPLDVVGGARQLERRRVASTIRVHEVDLLERDAARRRRPAAPRARRPTRTAADSPSRSRGMSVISSGCGLAMSMRSKSTSARSRSCQGRSLWPSMTGAFSRTASRRCRRLRAGARGGLRARSARSRPR